MDEPRLKPIFETVGEVLSALKKAFCDYEQKNGIVWQAQRLSVD